MHLHLFCCTVLSNVTPTMYLGILSADFTAVAILAWQPLEPSNWQRCHGSGIMYNNTAFMQLSHLKNLNGFVKREGPAWLPSIVSYYVCVLIQSYVVSQWCCSLSNSFNCWYNVLLWYADQ